MGLKDFFAKIFHRSNKRLTEGKSTSLPQQSTEEIEYGITRDGKRVIEFLDKQSSFKQFYNSTRLVIGNNPIYIDGHPLYEVEVSWYNDHDCVFFDENGRETGSRYDSKKVLAGLNMDLLQQDREYCAYAVRELLNKERVERYLAEGLQEKPQTLRGNYVGEIKQKEGEYGRIFYENVGRKVHNSPEMVSNRKQYEIQKEQHRQAKIEENKRKIAELQAQNNSLEGR